jgi:hypothetical protein
MIDFIISSGRITDMAAIPVPDLAVPYAAPRAATGSYMYTTIPDILKMSLIIHNNF